MKNIVLSILGKISRIDSELKTLTAQVEAQSLVIAALTLTIGKNGGMDEMVANIKQSIDAVLESADDILRSDAELLLVKFQEQLELTQLIDQESAEQSQSAENTGGHVRDT